MAGDILWSTLLVVLFILNNEAAFGRLLSSGESDPVASSHDFANVIRRAADSSGGDGRQTLSANIQSDFTLEPRDFLGDHVVIRRNITIKGNSCVNWTSLDLNYLKVRRLFSRASSATKRYC